MIRCEAKQLVDVLEEFSELEDAARDGQRVEEYLRMCRYLDVRLACEGWVRRAYRCKSSLTGEFGPEEVVFYAPHLAKFVPPQEKFTERTYCRLCEKFTEHTYEFWKFRWELPMYVELFEDVSSD